MRFPDGARVVYRDRHNVYTEPMTVYMFESISNSYLVETDEGDTWIAEGNLLETFCNPYAMSDRVDEMVVI